MTDTIESLREEHKGATEFLHDEIRSLNAERDALKAEYEEQLRANTRLVARCEELEDAATLRKLADAGIGTVPIGHKRLEWLNAQLKEAREIMRPLLHYHERGEHHDRLARFLEETE